MMSEKEREVLRRLEKQYAIIKEGVKRHLSKETWFGIRFGMTVATWECFNAFKESMSEEFKEELKKFRGEI